MKKILLLALALIMLLGCIVPAAAETVINPDELDYPVRTPSFKGDNPVVEGEFPFTGLKAETDEERDALERYTPIAVMFDNNAEGYMHKGVASADIIFQIPNQSTANNKQLVVFASHFPVYAGGCRSGRVTATPFVLSLNTAYASAGEPPMEDPDASLRTWRHKWKYNLSSNNDPKTERWFDLTSGRPYHHRDDDLGKEKVWSLVAHVQEIRNDFMLPKGIEFEKRPFLFTDEPLTRGEIANVIDMKFYETSDGRGGTNENSDCTFHYEDGMGYTRDILAGTEFDRETEEFLYFANVIVMRVKIKTKGVEGGSYLYYDKQLVGSGKADIFQNGRYIRGAWSREKEDSRLIFLDDEGNELKFQRGKSYIVVNNSNCVVSYDE